MRQAIPQSAPDAGSGESGDFWRGILKGLTPLGLLIVIVALTLGVVALARVLTIPLGFLTWQWVVVGFWVVGLLVTLAVYVGYTIHALRQAAMWQSAGLARQASGAYWALGIAALIVLLPVIIALALPQHPAQ